jgi:hypothetical protein
LLEEGTSGAHHHLVAALNDAILLWSVWRREVVVDPLIGIVHCKLGRRELAAIVRA